jgi:hypothetical protein
VTARALSTIDVVSDASRRDSRLANELSLRYIDKTEAQEKS